MSFSYVREYPVNGIIGWKGAIIDDKVTLQSLGDVIAATSWLNHGSKVMHVHYVAKILQIYCKSLSNQFQFYQNASDISIKRKEISMTGILQDLNLKHERWLDCKLFHITILYFHNW